MSLNTNSTYDRTAGGHTRAISAFFDTQGAAQKATDDLVAAGVAREQITMTAGQGTASATTGQANATENKSFMTTLKDLFLPEEDQYTYAEGLRRGGYLLTVRTDEAMYDKALTILDSDGAVNIDERESQWKSEGWTGYAGGAQGAGAGQTSAGRCSAMDHDSGVAAGTTTATAADRATLSEDRFAGQTVNTAATARTGTAANVQTLEATSDETIPVYEEQLRVGKRDVSHGRVRIRSYVVETPVNEQVSLHNEQVQVNRRTVDRPVTAGEALFQDRTIEAEERAEEAVVSKDARVTEEITLSKTAENRTQTINDTVRRTEVEVEDGRSVTGAATGSAMRFSAATDSARIAEHMDVIASDGAKIGVVDHLDGPDRIKLAKNASPDGQHHYVPLAWVDHVDTHVHLNKTAMDAKASW